MKKIFSESALENIATPEQLNQQIKVVKPHWWILLCVLVVLFLGTGIWVIFGNISSNTNIDGIVFPQLGVEKVVAQTDGIVKDVIFEIGDEVRAGDIVAVVENQEILQQISECRTNISRLSGDEKKKEQERLQQLLDLYDKTSLVRATKDGTIQSIIGMNEKTSVGDEVASVLINNQSSNNRQIVGYVPLVTASQLQLGMEAQVNPAYASREEYGYMKGVISSIGTMPVTQDELYSYYGNMEYVKDILPDASCVEVRISMHVDSASANNFVWSNKKGENLTVDVGTICNIQIVTASRKPYELFLQ